MTDALDAISARAEAAGEDCSANTTILLLAVMDDPEPGKEAMMTSRGFGSDELLAFWAHAQSDVTTLVRALRDVLALHEKIGGYDSLTQKPRDSCRRCYTLWPCPTVSAINGALDKPEEGT
jgi:hypothetical protein